MEYFWSIILLVQSPKHELQPILNCRICNSATQKSSVPTTVHNLYIWWSQLPTATATAIHPHFYFIHIAPHFKASHTWGMLTSKVDYSLMCKGQKLSDQPVLILVPAGEPYTRQPVRQFTHMVYFCPKLFLSWVALKVANGFLLLLLKQNTFLNIYTQKVGATVTHKIMYNYKFSRGQQKWNDTRRIKFRKSFLASIPPESHQK